MLLALPLLLASLHRPALAVEDGDEQQRMPIRGVVRAASEAVISTELTARISRIGFKEGERFDKNELLLALDCRRPKAELAAARARQKETEVTLRSASYLRRRGAGSRQEYDSAKARADRAKAEAQALAARLDQCEFRAPFAGAVTELKAHEYELTTSGKPLMSIIALQQPRIELIVPSNWLTWLSDGTVFRFRIDETREELPATVERIGAKIETVSQTIKIYASFNQPSRRVLPGMSGTAQFTHTFRGGAGE